MFQFVLSEDALADLEALSPADRQRIAARIDWLADNFEDVRPLPLTGRLAGQYKLRAGDYRALYTIDRAARSLTFTAIGHRSRIYRARP